MNAHQEQVNRINRILNTDKYSLEYDNNGVRLMRQDNNNWDVFGMGYIDEEQFSAVLLGFEHGINGIHWR